MLCLVAMARVEGLEEVEGVKLWKPSEVTRVMKDMNGGEEEEEVDGKTRMAW